MAVEWPDGLPTSRRSSSVDAPRRVQQQLVRTKPLRPDVADDSRRPDEAVSRSWLLLTGSGRRRVDAHLVLRPSSATAVRLATTSENTAAATRTPALAAAAMTGVAYSAGNGALVMDVAAFVGSLWLGLHSIWAGSTASSTGRSFEPR